MRRRSATLTMAVGFAVLLTGCSGDDGEPTTTTTEEAVVTTVAPAPPTTALTSTSGVEEQPQTTTSATGTTAALPTYTIVQRIEDEEGVTAVILIDRAGYDSLTDIDLQNIVEDAVDRFRVYAAHVVDSQEAADVVLSEATDPTPEGQALLAEHYLVRLEEGFRLVFEGPFTSEGTVILGS